MVWNNQHGAGYMVDDVLGNRAGHKVLDVVPAVGANDDQIDTEFSSRLRNDPFRFTFAQYIVNLYILGMQVANLSLHLLA